MNVLELMERLGGEVLANKVQAKVDGKLVYIGYIDGPDYVFTPEGHEMAAALEATKAADPMVGLVQGASEFTVKTVRRTRAKLVESSEPDPVE